MSFGVREHRYTYTDGGDVTRVEELFANRTFGTLTRVFEMGYDIRHRVTSEKRVNPLENNIARVVTYDYDKSDRVTTVTDATGRQVSYDYDAAGRMEKVKENGNVQATYSYFVNGLIEKATYANGSGVSYGYDDANRVNAVKRVFSATWD